MPGLFPRAAVSVSVWCAGKWDVTRIIYREYFLTAITVTSSFNKQEFISISAQIGSYSQLKWGSVEVFDGLMIDSVDIPAFYADDVLFRRPFMMSCP